MLPKFQEYLGFAKGLQNYGSTFCSGRFGTSQYAYGGKVKNLQREDPFALKYLRHCFLIEV